MGLGNRRDDELRWFWSACDQLGEPFGPLLKLLLLTGCRRSEVAEMTWSELSPDGSVWTIPGARTKNHRTHEVYLPPLARDLLASMHKIEGKAGFVFTTTGKTPVSGWGKLKARLDGRMAKAAAPEGRAVPDWRLHDLRRTAATGMAELGIAPHIVEATINHISGHKGGVAGVYNRAVHIEERKAALERWAAHVHAVVTDTAAKVIPLHRVTAIGGEARQ
jgi:integrase